MNTYRSLTHSLSPLIVQVADDGERTARGIIESYLVQNLYDLIAMFIV